MAEKKLGSAPENLLASIRQKIKEEGREARVYPENLNIGKSELPKTFTMLNEDPTPEAIPISEESANRSTKGVEGYRKTPEGLAWDVLSFKVKDDGIEKVLNVDAAQASLLEQLVTALDSGEGSNVRVTCEMRPSKKNPGQSYKAIRILGTEED